MEVAKGARASPASLLLLLSLSLSSASRMIAKNSKRVQLDGTFQCRTCGRRFATFQALGGHRTSHKRPRVRADGHRTSHKRPRVRADGLELLLGARPGKGIARPVHRCDTCGKEFLTGQALGGHMRRHRPARAAATTWAETTSSGLSEQHDDDENDAPSTLIQFI